MTIPKIIHQIWLDKSSMDAKAPAKYYSDKFISSFDKWMPDYEHIIWTRASVDQLILDNPVLQQWSDFYHNTLAYHIEKCDIARYMILFVKGGFYSDLDMQCNRSFDPLLERDFVCVRDWHDFGFWTRDPHVFNGFLAASPAHDYLFQLLNYIRYTYVPRGTIFDSTGPVALGRLAGRLNLLKAEGGGNYGENDQGKFFVDPCLIMPNSLLHRNNCDAAQAYVIPFWTEGTNWGLSHMPYYVPFTFETYYAPIMWFMLIVFIIILIIVIRHYRNRYVIKS